MRIIKCLNRCICIGLILSSGSSFADFTNTISNAADRFSNQAATVASQTGTAIKDSAITANIYAQIALDNNLSKYDISVSTDQAKVKLEGMVDFKSEANALIQLASQASGVKAVDASQLKIRQSKQPFSDTVITAKVKSEIFSNSILSNKNQPTDIHVETNNAIVNLEGRVTTLSQKETAIRLAKSVSGVVKVQSTIHVVEYLP